MDEYIEVRGWEKFQHYQKQAKGKDYRPTWIKTYVDLQTRLEWLDLSDQAKAHLVGLWLLAAQCNNRIPLKPTWVKQRIGATCPLRLQEIENAGFIQLYTNSRATLEQRREEERRGEENFVRSEHRTALSPGFARFWESYPARNGAKRGKRPAWEEWKKQKLEPYADGILRELQRQIMHKRNCDQRNQFAAEFPDAERWLKRKRWNDEVSVL